MIYPNGYYAMTNFLGRAGLAELAAKCRARSTGRITFGWPVIHEPMSVGVLSGMSARCADEALEIASH
jgi:hypothetical protein